MTRGGAGGNVWRWIFLRALFAAIAISTIGTPLEASRRRSVAPPSGSIVDVRYLNAAREAAAWLETLERRGPGDSLSWPQAEGASGGSAGVDLGAAGIGAFHLRLYLVTGEQRYLDKAVGAGAFIASTYANGGGGVDWLGGRAGGGDYFLFLYEVTRDPRWLQEAKQAATSLVAAGLGDEQTISWRNGNFYTGLAHGAAGIGLFFLHLHEHTGDAQYLEVARRAYRWTMLYTLPVGTGITFKRLTTDSTGYNGWCGGSVGAAIFFEELYRATGDTQVLATWRSTLQGLLDAAVHRGTTAEPQLAWRYGPTGSGSGGGFPVIYCHGGSSTAALFARTALTLHESQYREAAVAGGRWLDAVAIAETEGRSWNHISGGPLHELGLLTGTASVGHASIELYRALRDPKDLDRARAAAAWLLTKAEHNAPGQSKWITRTDTIGGTPRYDTGWYMGAAGIGLFFLELHDAERGDIVPRRFSIVNP